MQQPVAEHVEGAYAPRSSPLPPPDFDPIFCIACGTTLPHLAAFCRKCGSAQGIPKTKRVRAEGVHAPQSQPSQFPPTMMLDLQCGNEAGGQPDDGDDSSTSTSTSSDSDDDDYRPPRPPGGPPSGPPDPGSGSGPPGPRSQSRVSDGPRLQPLQYVTARNIHLSAGK